MCNDVSLCRGAFGFLKRLLRFNFIMTISIHSGNFVSTFWLVVTFHRAVTRHKLVYFRRFYFRCFFIIIIYLNKTKQKTQKVLFDIIKQSEHREVVDRADWKN